MLLLLELGDFGDEVFEWELGDMKANDVRGYSS
jgi:hypothetical protein